MFSREVIQALRKRYPRGTRIELLRMDDPQAPPIGTKGTVLGVIGVDNIARIMVLWDTGSCEDIFFGVDIFRKVKDDNDR